MNGAFWLTVNGSVMEPPRVTSPNVVEPVAANDVMVIFAVTEVSLLLVMLPLTPGLAEITVLAVARLVPVKVTLKVVPWLALAGFKSVRVGTGNASVLNVLTYSPVRLLPARSLMPPPLILTV